MRPWFQTVVFLVTALPATPALAAPPVGGGCDGCEVMSVDMPAALSAESRIAPEGQPGEPLVVEGRVFRSDGKTPASGVIVYAYHTDATGHYPPARSRDGRSVRHGQLRGWARTGADGRYVFRTIRPAPYPGRTMPAHVHIQIREPGLGEYYIDDVVFTDDPLVTPQWRARAENRGGSGIVTPTRDAAGVWHARRDIVLGRNIPNHPAR